MLLLACMACFSALNYDIIWQKKNTRSKQRSVRQLQGTASDQSENEGEPPTAGER
jgi:hypothetical protein